MHRIIHFLKTIKNRRKQCGQNKQIIINNTDDITRNMILLASISQVHNQTFSSYKNIYNGKDIVIVASGPTLKCFEPINNAIYIAVNRSFKYDKVKFDYLFMEDYHAVRGYIDDAQDYNCTKFYGITNHIAVRYYAIPITDWLIPESIAIRHSAKRFYSESPWLSRCIHPAVPFAYNLTSEPLYCYGSIMFSALQFALWTNPKRIYIVGMDNSQSGYFDNTKQEARISSDYIRKHIIKLKEFVAEYYPETKITMVNPVGLRGIFEDVYTKSYTENHPDITEKLGENLKYLET